LFFNKSDVKKKEQEGESYVIAAEAVQSGKSIYYTNIFVHAQAPTNKIMNNFSKSFRLKLQSLKLGFKPVKCLLNNYLENYGPSAYISSHANLFQQTFLIRDNITHILPTKEEGLINTDGILLGVNVNNGLPFLLEFLNFLVSVKYKWIENNKLVIPDISIICDIKLDRKGYYKRRFVYFCNSFFILVE